MSSEPNSSYSALRDLLTGILPTDADFQAFCLDFFPQTRRRFADGMERVAKTNLLLELEDAPALAAALRRYNPQRFAQLVHMAGDSCPSSGNPYRGLAAFEIEEASLFFGRETLAKKLWLRFIELYNKLDGSRLLTILGPSGSGKSSVARAGLLAELLQRPVPGMQAMRPIVLKPGAHPVRALAMALHPPRDTPPDIASQRKLIDDLSQQNRSGAFDGLTLWAANSTCTEGSLLVVLVDQFEEVYTLSTDKAEREAFVSMLLHAAQDQVRQVFVVLTLRSDFLGETQRQHLALNQLIVDQGVLVGGMSEDELRRAIALPAAQSGHPIDPSTVELLLRDTQGSDGALPLLQFALTQIWEGMCAGQAPGATLHQLGGVGGALAGKALEIFAALNQSQQVIARRAFVRLVHLGEGTRDSRRPAPLHELCGRGHSEAEVLSVLRLFATESARLITLSGDGLAAIAEATHESLFEHWKELRQWIDEDRMDRRLHDRVAESVRLWEDAGRPAGRLWRSPDLDLLHDYQRRKPDELSQLQAEFLRAGERQQNREVLLSWGSVVAVLLAVLIAGGIYITKERQRTADATRAGEQIHQQLLSGYLERGRQLLFVEQKPNEALLWLHRAQLAGAKDPALLDVLKSAMQRPEVTKRILKGHRASVRSAMFSPDGSRIVTASEDHTARVWNAKSGRLATELKGHRDDVLSATFSPEGRHIVTASVDHTARVWDAESGRLVAELKGHRDDVLSATFSPDGHSIATASADHTARVWAAESGRLVTELKGHGDDVLSVTFSPDGRSIATASADHTARVWAAESGQLVSELRGHGSAVKSATFSPDGRRIVTASLDATARAWEAYTGRVIAGLKGHGGGVLSGTFSPDGRRIVTASLDDTARVWNADTGQLVTEFKGHTDSVVGATFSPEGHRIVTASDDQTARVWEVDSGRLVAELKGHGSAIKSALFSPEGHRIITASYDQTARVWEVDSGRFVAELKGNADSVEAAPISPARYTAAEVSGRDRTIKVLPIDPEWVAAVLQSRGKRLYSATFSPDGHRILTASGDNTARIWTTESGKPLALLRGHEGSVLSAMFSPDGRRVVTTSVDNTARVWEANTGGLVVELRGHSDSVERATFSPDGRRIATASLDHTAMIWDAESGKLLARLDGHGGSVLSATFSPDGRRIATASWDHTGGVWDAESGGLLAELKGHGDGVLIAIFSPDGRRIVTASRDHTARVWETDTGLPVAELKGHTAGIYSATFSPDGRRVLTASEDHSARVWDADSGRLVAELKGHAAEVYSATFSPDGRRIVTASRDHTARMWDANSGRLTEELKGHGSSVLSATFSPDGRRIVTLSDDKAARVWDSTPETRSAEEIAKQLHCYVPLRFEQEGSDILIPTDPEPTECQQGAHAPVL